MKLPTNLKTNLEEALKTSNKLYNLDEAKKIICKYYPKVIRYNNKVVAVNINYKYNRRLAYIQYIIYTTMLYIGYSIATIFVIGGLYIMIICAALIDAAR